MKSIQLIRTVILLGFGVLLGSLLISGDIRQYVHPRFGVALIIACCVFFILAIIQIAEAFSDQHHPDRNFKRELLACMLLAFPLVCAFWIPSSSLGSDMIAKKTNDPTSQGTASVNADSDQKESWNPDISDDRFLAAMMVLYNKPADYVKRDIEFSGFVYHQNDFPNDCFLIARYGITCCAADAQVTGLLCRFPDQQKMPNDQWVRVKGEITIESYRDINIPVVEVSCLQLIDAPRNPYVY